MKSYIDSTHSGNPIPFMQKKLSSSILYFQERRIATNQLRSLIINACMHALNVQLKALRIGIHLRVEAY
ncbi:hypothetical protein T4D_622 [Trichinella pseudospiralis]|uniref:Uncharacterized protein n=1 Tax=Trichinella pseudospiralis TaxID=6337 RepID=A0A0V1FGR4_TRIPS|nr:hypothetical protein T4D_622 [Trichinella pseudospiralis]